MQSYKTIKRRNSVNIANKKVSPVDKRIVGRIDEIPEGCQFDKYVKTCSFLLSGEFDKAKMDKFELFLTEIFHDCLKFVTPVNPRLSIKLLLIYNNDEYLTLEKIADDSKTIIKKEIAKNLTTAFVLDNGLIAVIHVNVFRLLSCQNSVSMIFNYIDTLIHEINHIISHQRSEQEIHDLGIPILEKFLGIKIPEEYKNQKVSDNYF